MNNRTPVPDGFTTPLLVRDCRLKTVIVKWHFIVNIPVKESAAVNKAVQFLLSLTFAVLVASCGGGGEPEPPFVITPGEEPPAPTSLTWDAADWDEVDWQ